MELQLVLPNVDMQPAPPLRYRPFDEVECHECEETYTFSEGVFIDIGSASEFYCCDDCATDSGWVTCKDCDEWVKEDDSKEVGDDYFCDDCFNESYVRCAGCDNVCKIDESYSDPDGNSLCECCFSDNYSYCIDCSETVHNDDLVCRGDDYYCSGCDPGDEDHVGEDYSGSTTYTQVTDRCFGIELEYSIADSYETFAYFTNGSDHCGREFRSGILYGDGGLDAVRDLAEYAERNSWEANRECGYHLHLDCRGLELDQLKGVAWGYTRAHKLWEAFVNPYRAECSYSDFVYPTRADLDKLETMYDFKDYSRDLDRHPRGRYKFVNWAAYNEHITVEIRGHEGTLSACEICNWITAHTRFFDYVKDLGFAEIDKLFSGVIWRDFDIFGGIVGREISEFYAKQAAKHGRTVSIVRNRFAPLEASLTPC